MGGFVKILDHPPMETHERNGLAGETGFAALGFFASPS